MHRFLKPIPLSLAFLLFFGALTAPAIEKEPLDSYRSRRNAVTTRLADGVTVMFGATEASTGDAIWGFHQDENFYYLTGVTEPGAIVLLTPASGSNPRKEILFIPAHNRVQERWTGPKLGPDDADARERTGFDAVMPTSAFESELRRVLPSFGVIYTVLPNADDVSRLHMLSPFADVRNVAPELGRLRQVKSASELTLLEKAAHASMDAHLQAMEAVHPGMYEYEVAALMKFVFEREGCERPAYAPIAGSGFNSTVLHYSANRRRLEAGDLVVLDVAGEYSGYASDITRTLPVSGKFTPRQREIYEIVLGAQRAAFAAIKPGAIMGRPSTPGSVTKIAYDYMNTHGKDQKGEPLGKYFIHGLGHHVGLNVHDAGDPQRPLEAGMVITLEPGIYIPEESLGVRIEDLVLVTKDGARMLTESLPRDPGAVERTMAKSK